jgi:hypothetical protein
MKEMRRKQTYLEQMYETLFAPGARTLADPKSMSLRTPVAGLTRTL